MSLRTGVGLLLGIAISGMACSACSYHLPAGEVPKLYGGNAVDVDGERVETPPGRMTAEMKLHSGHALVVRSGFRSGERAFAVDADAVEALEEQGYARVDDDLDLTAGTEVRDSALWVRDDEGRQVGLPLESIEVVEVTDIDARNRSKALIIGAGATAAAVVAVVAVVALASALEDPQWGPR